MLYDCTSVFKKKSLICFNQQYHMRPVGGIGSSTSVSDYLSVIFPTCTQCISLCHQHYFSMLVFDYEHYSHAGVFWTPFTAITPRGSISPSLHIETCWMLMFCGYGMDVYWQSILMEHAFINVNCSPKHFYCWEPYISLGSKWIAFTQRSALQPPRGGDIFWSRSSRHHKPK